jgi:signal transduction histidine kinase
VVSVTPSPSADSPTGPSPAAGDGAATDGSASRWANPLAGPQRALTPRTFQARLTIGFVSVVALTLVVVGVLVLNRLDDYFTQQQEADLRTRANTVAEYVASLATDRTAGDPVVDAANQVDPRVTSALRSNGQQHALADLLGQADVTIRLSAGTAAGFVPAEDGTFVAVLRAQPAKDQAREAIASPPYRLQVNGFFPFIVEVTLSNPYTFRAAAIANVVGLLAITGLLALVLAMVVTAILTRRFTTPLRRLTEATRDLAEGDLSRRVPADQVSVGTSELTELAVQFNTMADRLEQSIDIIRRDRDRSRDFLADVSHELRTPLAALRTFNELLRQQAAGDPEARAEFIESSGQQIDRLDWLAQNLLELSKLDSGLVLLDLRPDDLRAAVESAVEQARPAARKRGVSLELDLPEGPVRIRHDPQRIGQVVSNLVGNAIKFTQRSGHIAVAVKPIADGAQIEVADTGIGIDAAELPRIFDRFYRGTRANEARGSGSGLGLAIVRSIVDMHGGTVVVESRVGTGSKFVVTLPRDGRPADAQADVASGAADLLEETSPQATGTAPVRAMSVGVKVADSSPAEASHLNPGTSP